MDPIYSQIRSLHPHLIVPICDRTEVETTQAGKQIMTTEFKDALNRKNTHYSSLYQTGI